MKKIQAMGYNEHHNDYDTYPLHPKDAHNTVSAANGLASNEFTLDIYSASLIRWHSS